MVLALLIASYCLFDICNELVVVQVVLSLVNSVVACMVLLDSFGYMWLFYCDFVSCGACCNGGCLFVCMIRLFC